MPFVDQIELTNRCPMRCGFCPRGVPGRMQRPLGFMDVALFERGNIEGQSIIRRIGRGAPRIGAEPTIVAQRIVRPPSSG